MAPYKRLSIAGHGRPARAARKHALTPLIRAQNPHDAQPVQGMLVAVPLGLACWALLGGLGMMVAELVG